MNCQAKYRLCNFFSFEYLSLIKPRISSPELLEFGLDRARAFPLFTTSLKLSSSLELEPRLGPTSNI